MISPIRAPRRSHSHFTSLIPGSSPINRRACAAPGWCGWISLGKDLSRPWPPPRCRLHHPGVPERTARRRRPLSSAANRCKQDLGVRPRPRHLLSAESGDRRGHYPTWTDDSRALVFAGTRDGGWGLFRKSIDASISEALERFDVTLTYPTDVSSSGELVVLKQWSRSGFRTLILNTMDQTQRTIEDGSQAMLSPDDRWIAYAVGTSRGVTGRAAATRCTCARWMTAACARSLGRRRHQSQMARRWA